MQLVLGLTALSKLTQEKSVVRFTNPHNMTIYVDWGVKPQTKQNKKHRLAYEPF